MLEVQPAFQKNLSKGKEGHVERMHWYMKHPEVQGLQALLGSGGHTTFSGLLS